jgi:hypothetical protein
MPLKEIFNQYFRNKLLIGGSIGIVATLVRLFGGHETSFAFAATFLLFFIIAALIIGFIDYRFYEKSAPKIIAKLIDKEPLYSFQNKGFKKQEEQQLEGRINNYKIILSPLTNMESGNVLIVLIPLQIREGLDKYFKTYDEHFKLRLSNEIILAEATFKNYEKVFDYNKLFNLIDRTTLSLRENKIEPLNIVAD